MKNSRSKKKSKSYWQPHVEAQSQSGLTQREYCRQNNISYWSFNSWKRKLEKETNEFHEISPDRIPDLSTDEKQIQITLKNQHIISIPNGFSKDTLRDILTVLGELQ